ncbi:unnamed protein product [Protopolystoma xenopodis]|uniref:Uncharacterized protein n=1 Tax=Protopolystoma xenopodis TaxID=117903 RepID=A0A3S5CH85_9PLAT|nr:unnamed protein product [Protopolystoma xenopodis]
MCLTLTDSSIIQDIESSLEAESPNHCTGSTGSSGLIPKLSSAQFAVNTIAISTPTSPGLSHMKQFPWSSIIGPSSLNHRTHCHFSEQQQHTQHSPHLFLNKEYCSSRNFFSRTHSPITALSISSSIGAPGCQTFMRAQLNTNHSALLFGSSLSVNGDMQAANPDATYADRIPYPLSELRPNCDPTVNHFRCNRMKCDYRQSCSLPQTQLAQPFLFRRHQAGQIPSHHQNYSVIKNQALYIPHEYQQLGRLPGSSSGLKTISIPSEINIAYSFPVEVCPASSNGARAISTVQQLTSSDQQPLSLRHATSSLFEAAIPTLSREMPMTTASPDTTATTINSWASLLFQPLQCNEETSNNGPGEASLSSSTQGHLTGLSSLMMLTNPAYVSSDSRTSMLSPRVALADHSLKPMASESIQISCLNRVAGSDLFGTAYNPVSTASTSILTSGKSASDAISSLSDMSSSLPRPTYFENKTVASVHSYNGSGNGHSGRTDFSSSNLSQGIRTNNVINSSLLEGMGCIERTLTAATTNETIETTPNAILQRNSESASLGYVWPHWPYASQNTNTSYALERVVNALSFSQSTQDTDDTISILPNPYPQVAGMQTMRENYSYTDLNEHDRRDSATGYLESLGDILNLDESVHSPQLTQLVHEQSLLHQIQYHYQQRIQFRMQQHDMQNGLQTTPNHPHQRQMSEPQSCLDNPVGDIGGLSSRHEPLLFDNSNRRNTLSFLTEDEEPHMRYWPDPTGFK